MAEYIVLETMGGAEDTAICTDENGRVMIFYAMNDAQEFADVECQEGLVVQVE